MNKYLILCILIILSLFGFITYFLKKRISNYNEKSKKVKVLSLWALQKTYETIITPAKPPWKDIPPSHI